MYYTLEEAANVLSLTPGEVNRLREQGVLRGLRDGSNWKFEKDKINAYLVEKTKKASAALLSGEGDEEGPTMLAADSADFDAMFDQAADGTDAIVAKDDLLDLTKEEDELALAPEEDDQDLVLAENKPSEDDELALAPDEDDQDLVLAEDKPSVDDELALPPEEGNDDLLLVAEDEPESLTDEASALVEDEPDAESNSSSAVDLAGETGASDDDLLHLGSDSGLSLLDDVDVGGSNVSLGDEEGDLVLGGSGSGSGSGLNLSSDSGLELLGDSDADFSLDADADAPTELAAADEGVFELAPEVGADAQVLSLEQSVDSDAPTELAPSDEGIFELAEDVSSAALDESSSDSNSASQLIDIDDSATNPFLTEVEESSSTSMDAFSTSTSESDLFQTSEDPSSIDSPFASFGSADDSSSSSPFGAAPEESSSSSGFGGVSFEKSDSISTEDSFGSVDFAPVDSTEPIMPGSRAPIASTNYTGKDLIFLVPCLLFLILATIGAYELCRTIWSYQEGSFDLTGPVLETIAKMVKLI